MVSGSLPRSRPAVFGEVLFDCFEDGSEILGGAPFNVAWHLAGFGSRPLFVSRVGDDERASRIRHRMSRWGLDDHALQTDPTRATGTVEAHVEDGQPTYTIAEDRAYDHVDPEAVRTNLTDHAISVVYHGTLALRGETSRAAFDRLVETDSTPLFYDVNIRDPHTPVERVRERLRRARWVKLNAEELGRVLGRELEESDRSGVADAARVLQKEFGPRTLLVTCGSDGSLAIDVDGAAVHAGAAPVEEMVDTVGAGDAFAAVCLWGVLRRWPWELILPRAARFASIVCGWRGATADDRELYRTLRAEWEHPHADEQ